MTTVAYCAITPGRRVRRDTMVLDRRAQIGHTVEDALAEGFEAVAMAPRCFEILT